MNKIKNKIIEQFNCYIHQLPNDSELINPNGLGNSIYRQYLIDLNRIVDKKYGQNIIKYYTTEGVELTITAGQIRAFFENEIDHVKDVKVIDEKFKDYPKEFEGRMVDCFKLKS